MALSQAAMVRPGFERGARIAALGIVMAIIAQSSASAAKRDCGTSQTEMKLCAADAANAVAAKMNRLYQKLMKKVVEETNERRLCEAQAAWLDYRTKQCQFATAGFEGGSIRPMLVADWYPIMTADRIQQIELDLNCREVEFCGHQ